MPLLWRALRKRKPLGAHWITATLRIIIQLALTAAMLYVTAIFLVFSAPAPLPALLAIVAALPLALRISYPRHPENR